MTELPQPWPSAFSWFPAETPSLNIAICDRALADLGMCETPPSSNRGGRIDTYNTRAGAPLGSYWCASAASAWWVDAGASVPPSARAACETWMTWAKGLGTWHADPTYGAAVLYGTKNSSGNWVANSAGHLAHHIGIIIRVTPYLLSFEGNTSYAGFSTNGEAVCLKKVDTTRVLGYVHPQSRGV